MSQPGFWDNQEAAQLVVAEKRKLGAVVDPLEKALKIFPGNLWPELGYRVEG